MQSPQPPPAPDADEPEYVAASRAAQVRVVVALLLAGLTIVVLKSLSTDQSTSTESLLLAVYAACAVMATGSVLLSAWFIRLGRGTRADGRFPPASMAMPLRTRIVRGVDAKKVVRACFVYAAFAATGAVLALGIAAVIVPAVL